MTDHRASIGQIPPRAPLTPEEQDALLADLAAAYAIEILQTVGSPGSNTGRAASMGDRTRPGSRDCAPAVAPRSASE